MDEEGESKKLIIIDDAKCQYRTPNAHAKNDQYFSDSDSDDDSSIKYVGGRDKGQTKRNPKEPEAEPEAEPEKEPELEEEPEEEQEPEAEPEVEIKVEKADDTESVISNSSMDTQEILEVDPLCFRLNTFLKSDDGQSVANLLKEVCVKLDTLNNTLNKHIESLNSKA
jgi:hypothetical protein